MGAMSPWHWAIVILVFLLLFGAKRLPDAARGLGRSLRIFKSEMSQMSDDGAKPAAGTGTLPAPQPLPAAPSVTTPTEAQRTDHKSA